MSAASPPRLVYATENTPMARIDQATGHPSAVETTSADAYRITPSDSPRERRKLPASAWRVGRPNRCSA